MKVGFIGESTGMMQSIEYVFQGIEHALAEKHEIIYRPLDIFYEAPHSREEMYENFLRSCDVLIGRIDGEVLQVRDRMGEQPPFIAMLLGTMSRGASDLAGVAGYLKSTDVLVGNCAGDVEIARKFFRNAQTRILPFVYDESTFYPSNERERQSIKADLGFRKDDKILLYVGRMTIEKNFHTLLKIFSVAQNLVPDLHLVVAGEFMDRPFTEFGVYSVNIRRTITNFIGELGLDAERIHFLGQKNPTQLRDIYTVADVLVNMTLHHDENFGFAQVEAMACGTPVVGTCWGGLKDTIKHCETGYQISTVVTDSGIKINWWEAINRIIYLFTNELMLRRFRERCHLHAIENFSMPRYSEILDSILTDCIKANKSGGEPLDVTDFADQYWLECNPRSSSPPPYQRGRRAFELYKELIASFTGTTGNIVPANVPMKEGQLLVLAAPVQIQKGMIKIDDPIFPFEHVIPEANQQSCKAVLEILSKEPVIRVERLENLIHTHMRSSVHSALKWMLDTGILLRTTLMDAPTGPEIIGEQMAKPIFSVQNVNYLTDVVVIK
jgi:hypothetical protein